MGAVVLDTHNLYVERNARVPFTSLVRAAIEFQATKPVKESAALALKLSLRRPLCSFSEVLLSRGDVFQKRRHPIPDRSH